MTQMNKEKRTLIRFVIISLTFADASRVIRGRVSPPVSGMVIKSQTEQMRASQSLPVSIVNILND